MLRPLAFGDVGAFGEVLEEGDELPAWFDGVDGVSVNLALTRAPVIDDVFVWAGASLLRRLRLEQGDPVHGCLAPVDPDHVPIPSDLAAALSGGALRRWEELRPADRRRRLVPLDAAATTATRQRRLAALVESLGA